MAQQWHDLLFIHWPIEVGKLRSLVPEPLVIDSFEGSAWLAVVPFHMSGIHLRGLPTLPKLSAFAELNVRTYVTVEGKPGVYFFFDLQNRTPSFYYIGISGTMKHQTQALRERLDKHLLVRDFVFYALAFPEHAQTYFDDVIRFYVQGKYPKKIKQYRREFDGLEHAPPTHVAWVSRDSYSYTDRDGIETHLIREFDPPANQNKKKAPP